MGNKATILRAVLLSGASAVLIVSTEAHAQVPESAAPAKPAPTATSAPADQIGDILVFANKRSAGQLAQTVPAAITAISPDALERTNARDVTDIQRLVPNVSFRTGTFPSYPNYEIRGIAVNSTLRSVDPAINTVQDGMVIAYPAGALLSVFDLESIEVLRGPQGVLFGRNASGGAVVLRTRLPGEKFRATASASYGNFNEVQLKGSVEGAIAPGITAKVAVSQRWNDGYYKNTLDGTFVPAPGNPTGLPVQHATGGVHTNEFIIKPTIVFRLGDDVRFTLFTQYARARNPGGFAYMTAPPAGGPAVPFTALYGYTPSTKPYTQNVQEPGYSHIDAGHAIGQFDWKVGPGTFTAVAAYREVQYNSTQNSDGTPFNLTIFPDNREHNQQKSLEARYAGNVTDELSFVVGAFLLQSDTDVLEKRKLAGVNFGTTLAQQISLLNTFRTQQTVWDQTTKSAAVFGNVDWKVIPSLTLSAGLRYSRERKSIDIIPLALCTGPADFQGCPTTYVSSTKSWSDLSPRLVASWQVADRNTLYASYAKGFRSGNFNARATSLNALGPDDPESNASYEIGSKNDFMDGHVRLNIAAFYQDFKNIERLVTVPVNNQSVQTLVNAASAVVKGVEGELSVIPFKGLRLDGNIGRVDAKYKSFASNINFVPLLVGGQAGQDPLTLKFDRVPKWRYTIGGQYDWELLGGAWSVNASYAWRSGFFTDFQNTPALSTPAVGFVDAGLSYTRGNVKYSLYGRNLTNELFPGVVTRAFNYFATGGVPRTYGMQVSLDF